MDDSLGNQIKHMNAHQFTHLSCSRQDTLLLQVAEEDLKVMLCHSICICSQTIDLLFHGSGNESLINLCMGVCVCAFAGEDPPLQRKGKFLHFQSSVSSDVCRIGEKNVEKGSVVTLHPCCKIYKIYKT